MLVDRIVVEVWVPQPIIHGAILDRFQILPKVTREDIHFQAELSELQRSAILGQLKLGQKRDRLDRVNLYMNVYCDSRVGSFMLRITKEMYNVLVEGIPAEPPAPS